MKKLPKFDALVMQASNNIYLSMVSCEIKYVTYILAGGYKSLLQGG
jgi:hypothetical protein